MRRHLIAGAFACFGSSLFGQTITSPANQPQRALNNAQNTLQSGLQSAQNSLNRTVPQNPDNAALDNGQNRASLNAQGQARGLNGATDSGGLQSNTNSQNDANFRNNSSPQYGQPDSNFSTQTQGQSTLRPQQNQSISGQSQPQYSNTESWQNSGRLQNQQSMQSGNRMLGENVRQSSQSQNNGIAYPLRKDAYGREFICVNGRSVYFDNADSVSSRGNPGTGIQYRAGYGNYDLQNGQSPSSQSSQVNRPDEQRNTFQGNGNNEGSQSAQYQGQSLYQGQPMQRIQSQPSYSQSNGGAHALRTDANGREFICVNGRPVYFDNTHSPSTQSNSSPQNQYRQGGYGNGGVQNSQNWAPSSDPSVTNQQAPGSIRSSADDRSDSRNVDPANSRTPLDGTNDTSPPVDRSDSQRQSEPNGVQTDGEPGARLDRGSDTAAPSDSSSGNADLPKS